MGRERFAEALQAVNRGLVMDSVNVELLELRPDRAVDSPT